MSSSLSSATPRVLLPSTSTNEPPSYDESRQQAGPLPSKRGELGFIEGVHTPLESSFQENTLSLPERHPADRSNPSSPTVAVPLTPVPVSATGNAQSQPSPPSSAALPGSTDTPAADKPTGILKFLHPKPIPAFQGLRVTTLLAFFAQTILLTAFIVAWVFTARKLSGMGQDGGKVPGGVPSIVFLHVVFAFAIIGQLIFLERRVYRLRAERYAHLHPGEMLPRYTDRTAPGGDLAFAYAPWNRPPLPTYAAALAQSGHGTGDVDDHLIAVPPPPAYGQTRGSTLLLSGFLRESLRAQRPPSVHSERDVERGEPEPEPRMSNRESHLQQTLATLERSTSRPGGH
ncbi:hypothetical protein D9611_013780 [Ephemerocybe angulata]|uniref:Uncharacterized protein n=1 Tax=Ephemerocybe angulata TaxID=980116 RepID=A0A8H5FFF8_9AGAR|nr:hypothetical protein D9611_013780 [Tulosesus angulatus]